MPKFLTIPVADGDSLANAKIHNSKSISGLVGSTAYRCYLLSEASDAFTPTGDVTPSLSLALSKSGTPATTFEVGDTVTITGTVANGTASAFSSISASIGGTAQTLSGSGLTRTFTASVAGALSVMGAVSISGTTYSASASGTVTAAPTIVMLTSPYFASFGDSQIQGSTFDMVAGSPTRGLQIGQSGWTAFLQSANNRALSLVHSYGQGGATTAQLKDLAATHATAAVAAGAKNVIIVCGGNDGPTGDVPTSIANYTTMFNAYAAAGLRIFTYVVPKASAPSHIARREWLKDPARAVTWPGFTYLDVWGTLQNNANAGAADGEGINPLYSIDNTHLNALGGKVLGEKLAELLAPYIPAAFPRVALPVNASDTVNGFILTTASGGTLVNNSDCVVNGTIPAGLTVTIPATLTGLTITFALNDVSGQKELQIDITGRTGSVTDLQARLIEIVATPLDNAQTGALGVDETTALHGVARVQVKQGSTGLHGVQCLNRVGGSSSLGREMWVGCASNVTWDMNRPGTFVDAITDPLMGNQALDYKVITPLAVVKPGYSAENSKSLQRKIFVSVATTGKVDTRITVSNWATVKVPLGAYPMSYN